MFFSLSYSARRSALVSSSYFGIRRCVRNLRRIVSMTSLEIRRNSSRIRTFARLPRLESDAVTTLIYDPFRKTIFASVPFILVSFMSISAANSGEFGLSSNIIFSKTLMACPLVPDAIHTLVPGHRIQRITQNTALMNVLPIPRAPMNTAFEHRIIIVMTIFWKSLRSRCR